MNVLVRSILLLVLIDTSWATYSICADPRTSGGATHFPHPTNCAKFIMCNWGQPMEHDCPSGTLWNDFVKTCDHARNVRCRSGQLLNSVVPENHPNNPNCPRVVNMHRPVYAPHQDCSKFRVCTAMGTQEMQCNPGFNWNAISNRCEWSGTTAVIPNSPIHIRPTPLPTTTSRPSTTTPGILPTSCPRIIDQTKPVFLPHSECSKFYVCTLEGPIELKCKPGYHWSIRANRCELPWDAGCIDFNASPFSTTTPKASIPQTTTQATIKTCPSQVDPDGQVFLPHPDGAKMYICLPGIGRVELHCPVGMRWNKMGGCIPVEGARSDSPHTGVIPISQSTTIGSNIANATDASTKPDEAIGTDVPIFG
ncbi:probable chitinase 10 [Aedes aegypti]|uniref:Chitin-binding type-2 domain-containing protein n=1 Tax=Aedes aegypti TaxID=7159 RepID=A0A1S4F1Y6_AEDAE|nr:probable chitinase 10 [Aedes aegypti]